MNQVIDIFKYPNVCVIEPGGKKINLDMYKISLTLDEIRKQICADRDTGFLAPFLNEPIILSFEDKTAWTNGVRIVMNPIFFYSLRVNGAYDRSPETAAPGLAAAKEAFNKTKLHVTTPNVTPLKPDWYFAHRYIIYLILHEVYHCFYNHLRRERLYIEDLNR